MWFQKSAFVLVVLLTLWDSEEKGWGTGTDLPFPRTDFSKLWRNHLRGFSSDEMPAPSRLTEGDTLQFDGQPSVKKRLREVPLPFKSLPSSSRHLLNSSSKASRLSLSCLVSLPGTANMRTSILSGKCQWVPIVEEVMLPRRWIVAEGAWEMPDTGLGAPLALAHLASQELWVCSCMTASISEIKDSNAHRRWENCPRPGSEFHCELWSLIFRIQEAKQTSVACHSTVWGTYWALIPIFYCDSYIRLQTRKPK